MMGGRIRTLRNKLRRTATSSRDIADMGVGANRRVGAGPELTIREGMSGRDGAATLFGKVYIHLKGITEAKVLGLATSSDWDMKTQKQDTGAWATTTNILLLAAANMHNKHSTSHSQQYHHSI